MCASRRLGDQERSQYPRRFPPFPRSPDTGHRLLALKGISAADEIAEHGAAVARLGGGPAVVHQCGVGLIDPPTTVVEIVREREVVPKTAKPSRRAGRGGRRR